MLIVLIIAMTLIALLGAGLVSMVSSKQQGFTLLLNGDRANMIAKGGVEWAIRYISDGLSDTSSTYYTHLPTQPPFQLFNGGQFNVTWNYNSDMIDDNITVTGSYGGVTTTTKLSNFRLYLRQIILSPFQPLSKNNLTIRIPVLGNGINNATILVNQITLTVPAGSYLQTITFNGFTPTTLFDYNSLKAQDWFGSSIVPNTGLLYPSPSGNSFNNNNSPVLVYPVNVPSSIQNVSFDITFGQTLPTGQCTITFNGHTVPDITFTL